jgi:hypothetical protein
VRIGQVKQELGKGPSTPVAQEIFQLRQENNNLQKDLDELQRLHIRSINGFGIDLEPITDEAFQKQFRELYSQVSRWCRRVSRSKNKNSRLGEGTSLLYPARCLDKTVVQNLSLANSVEMATWMFMEKKILSVWFPGIGTELADSAAVLETLVRSGGK